MRPEVASSPLSGVRLMAIVDTGGREVGAVLSRAEYLCEHAEPGSVLLQLRNKDESARCRVLLGSKLRHISSRSGQLLAINDRPDIAMLVGADAVHLGESSLSPWQVRELGLPSGALVLVARHEPDDLRPDGADGVVLSPIVAQRKGRAALGLHALGVARRALPPTSCLYALGGVDADCAAECVAMGADGVAVVGAAWDAAPDPRLLDALEILR